MSTAWGGVDPTSFSDPGIDYELGVRWLSNEDINISAIRIYGPSTSASLSNRKAYIRTTADVILATIVLPDTLTAGWVEYPLDDVLNVAPNQTIWTTYGTLTDYAAVPSGTPQDSGDSAVTANSGGFSDTVGNLPSTLNTTFYGIDFVYEVVQHFPPIVTLSIQQNDLDVTAAIIVDDDHPETVNCVIDWGDGDTDNVGTALGPHAHSYATGGLYAVMVTATDADSNVDSYATAINLSAPAGTDSSEEWIDDILDAIVSDIQMSGYFDRVNEHEPKSSPGHGITAAVWCDRIENVGRASGLAITAALLTFVVRTYKRMNAPPEDTIDRTMMKAVSNLSRRYHDDFDFSGAIGHVDLLGAYSQGMYAQAGYIEVDKTNFRVFDLYIPCIVYDVWPQAK